MPAANFQVSHSIFVYICIRVNGTCIYIYERDIVLRFFSLTAPRRNDVLPRD